MNVRLYLAVLVVLLFNIRPAAAFPIAVGGEGLSIYVSSTSAIIATYEGNSASYSNDLYLMLDDYGNPADDGDFSNDLLIFNNQTSAVGSTVDLGSFAVGTELQFRLHVNNTGYDYYTGPADRNPDDHAHATVQEDWAADTTLVSFEDLFNGPFNYNDLSFSFTNTSTTPVPTASTPEPASLALLGSGIAVYVSRRRGKIAPRL